MLPDWCSGCQVVTHAGPEHLLKGMQVHVERVHPEPPSPASASHTQSQHWTQAHPSAACSDLFNTVTHSQIGTWPSTVEVPFQVMCSKRNFWLYLFVFLYLSVSLSLSLSLSVLLSLSFSVPTLTPRSVSLTPHTQDPLPAGEITLVSGHVSPQNLTYYVTSEPGISQQGPTV